jgi:hypothetical protein
VLQTLIHYAEKSSIFLLTVALIVGATGCSVALPPIGSAEPRYITTWAELDDIRNNLVGTYYLKGNLTTDMPDWAKVAGPDAHNGTGWWPIGVEFGQFRGHFYGMGNQICGLVINSERNEVGLFGYVAWPGSIHDVSVVNVTVHGTEFVGALVGRNNGNVNNCSCSGSVTGNYCVGGLVGWNDAGARIEKSSLASTCNVTGQDYVGGLVGWNKGTVRESYCSGRVIGADGVGGLVGFNDRGIIAEYSRSTGSVEGTKYVGGHRLQLFQQHGGGHIFCRWAGGRGYVEQQSGEFPFLQQSWGQRHVCWGTNGIQRRWGHCGLRLLHRWSDWEKQRRGAVGR